jgi:DNA polymerase-3 subunit alpha
MQIVMQLAGFSMGRSDLVRKAMSKKDMKAMEAERKNFVYGNEELAIDGCVNRGISEEIANHIYDEMVSFGEYAFNKSHAAVYSVVAYQTAWLKCYYPQEFMAAQMTSVLNQTTKLSHYIYHCRQQLGISILPPDVNDGVRDFAAVDGQIRYGLTAIKGLGHAVVDAILLERKKRGAFRDFYDFVERLSSKEVNKRTLEALIKAGALDSLGATRKQMMQVYTKVLDSVAQDKKKRITGQMSLFDMMGGEDAGMRVTMPNCGEYDNDVKLAFEKEVLGIYVSGHPLEQYVDNLAKNTTASTADFVADEDGKCNVKDGKSYVIGGIVSDVTVKTTRRGDQMAFVMLEDMIASVEVVLFPKQYEMHKQYLTEDRKVYIKGKAQIGSYSSGNGEDGEEEQIEVKLIADRVVPFEDAPKKLWLQFETHEQYQAQETWLKDVLTVYRDEYRSAVPVIVYIKSTKQRIFLPREYHVRREQEVIDLLVERYGEENVKVTESGIESLR